MFKNETVTGVLDRLQLSIAELRRLGSSTLVRDSLVKQMEEQSAICFSAIEHLRRVRWANLNDLPEDGSRNSLHGHMTLSGTVKTQSAEFPTADEIPKKKEPVSIDELLEEDDDVIPAPPPVKKKLFDDSARLKDFRMRINDLEKKLSIATQTIIQTRKYFLAEQECKDAYHEAKKATKLRDEKFDAVRKERAQVMTLIGLQKPDMPEPGDDE